jgi:hypothetical protein
MIHKDWFIYDEYEPQPPEPSLCDGCGKITDALAFCEHCGAPLFDPEADAELLNPENDE